MTVQTMEAGVPVILKGREGIAVRLDRGEILMLENIHGNQVVDTWAVSCDDPLEYSAMEHTRSVNSNLLLEAGMTVVSNYRRGMFTLVADETTGRHDTLLCPCSAEIYQELGCKPGHGSCTANFHKALASLGLELPFTPASLNLFMNVPFEQNGALDRLPPASRAGQALWLKAERDIYLILSACPQDITPINGAEHTPADIRLMIENNTHIEKRA